MQPQENDAKNFIDDDLVKCFSIYTPIHTLQRFLGSSRINIKNQLVTEPSVCEKLYTFVCIAAFSFSFCYLDVYYYMSYYDLNITLYVISIIGMFVQHISYVTNIIHARFCKSDLTVILYIKLQKVDSILPLKEFKHLKNVQYYRNIIWILLIVIPFECGFIVFSVATIEYPILTVFAAMGLLIVYMELALATSLISYLVIHLRYLNKIVKFNVLVKHGENKALRTSIILNERLIISSDLNGNKKLDLDKFLICIKEVLKLYKIITEVYSFPVLNIATTLFVWALLIIQGMIIGWRTGLIPTIVIVIMGLWIVFYFLLLTMLALVSDYFIKEVKETKLHCIKVMSYCFEGVLRKGANDILQTIQFYEPTFSVYGIFVLDRKLPLTLMGIITTNLVVLIQFTMHL